MKKGTTLFNKEGPIGMIVIKFGLKDWMLVKIARCCITAIVNLVLYLPKKQIIF